MSPPLAAAALKALECLHAEPQRVDWLQNRGQEFLRCARDARIDTGTSSGLAIVPCDNVPDNGPWLERGATAAADLLDPDLASWLRDEVAFVGTSVDRITPRLSPADVDAVSRASGAVDAAPVVTEPFTRKEDLQRLRPLEPELDTPYVIETVRNLVRELPVPLIGFAGAPFTVAMHFGTFQLTDESIDEPERLLREALATHGVPPDRFRVPAFGESVAVPDRGAQAPR